MIPLDGGPERSQMKIEDIIWWKMQLELPWLTVTVYFVTGSELLLCVKSCDSH